MKVVLLCGGFGTRFKEETEMVPKPMIPVGGKPIIWHIMKYYASFGFNDFILCAGYKCDVIKDYFYHYKIRNNDFTIRLDNPSQIEFHGNVDDEDWTVTIVDTGLNTLKGGRLKKIERYIDGNQFMMTYGDGLADVNLHDLVSFHEHHGKVATLTGVHPPSLFGDILVNENGQATLFSEKSQSTAGIINGGFFVLNKNIFEYLEDSDSCDFEIGPLEEISRAGNLMVYEHLGTWACMDTQRDNQYLNKLWREGRAFWKKW